MLISFLGIVELGVVARERKDNKCVGHREEIGGAVNRLSYAFEMIGID